MRLIWVIIPLIWIVIVSTSGFMVQEVYSTPPSIPPKGPIIKDIEINEETNTIYFLRYNDYLQDREIIVLDGKSYNTVTTIPVKWVYSSITIDEKSELLYNDHGQNSLTIINSKNNTVTKVIDEKFESYYTFLAINPNKFATYFFDPYNTLLLIAGNDEMLFSDEATNTDLFLLEYIIVDSINKKTYIYSTDHPWYYVADFSTQELWKFENNTSQKIGNLNSESFPPVSVKADLIRGNSFFQIKSDIEQTYLINPQMLVTISEPIEYCNCEISRTYIDTIHNATKLSVDPITQNFSFYNEANLVLQIGFDKEVWVLMNMEQLIQEDYRTYEQAVENLGYDMAYSGIDLDGPRIFHESSVNKILSVYPYLDGLQKLVYKLEYVNSIVENIQNNKIYYILDSSIVFVNDSESYEVSTLSVGGTPIDIEVNPFTNLVYVLYADGWISIFDSEKDELKRKIFLSKSPSKLVINTNTNKIYVITDNQYIFIIDGNENKIIKNISTLNYTPVDIEVNSNTGAVFVINQNSDDVFLSNDDFETTNVLNLNKTSQKFPLKKITLPEIYDIILLEDQLSKNILCKEGLELIFKIRDNSSACVKPQTAEKLIERDWGKRT